MLGHSTRRRACRARRTARSACRCRRLLPRRLGWRARLRPAAARLRSLLALQQQHFFKDFSFVDARSKKFHPQKILEKYFPDGPVTSSDFVSDDTSFRDFSPDSK